jgi:hypothetical protein
MRSPTLAPNPRPPPSSDPQVKTFHDSDFLKQLELAVQYGSPFLLEGLDEYIDPVINPVLERAFTINAAGKRVIRLGDKEVEWDDNFRCRGRAGAWLPGCLAAWLGCPARRLLRVAAPLHCALRRAAHLTSAPTAPASPPLPLPRLHPTRSGCT